MRHRIFLLGVAALWLPDATPLAQAERDPAVAETPMVVQVGSRVRVISPEVGAQPLVGQVVTLEPDAVVVAGSGGGAQRRVPVGSASSLEVSAGTKSKAGRGAMIGGGIGALSGVLMNIGDYNGDNNTLVVSIVGAASGAAIGALVGLAFKSESWRPARVPPVSAAIAPVPRGAALSVRVTWGRAATMSASR